MENKLLLSFLLLLFSNYLLSQESSTTIHFPDKKFKKALIKRGFDKNDDGEIQINEVDTIKILDISKSKIISLAGIEYFVNLETLNCSKNKLSDLNFSKNLSLHKLDCRKNKLRLLDISNNSNLEVLDIEVDEITAIADLYFDQESYQQAESLYEASLKIIEKVLGKEHLDYTVSLNNLAIIYQGQGLYAKAELLYEESLKITEKILGKESLDYAISLHNLANIYQYQGLYTKAELLYEESLNIKENVLGKESLDYSESLHNLAVLYRDQGLYAKAEPLYEESLNIKEQVSGKEDLDYAESLHNLATLYHLQGLYSKAESLYKESSKIIEKVSGKEHSSYALSLHNLAILYNDQRLYAKAEPLYEESLKIKEKVSGKEHPDYASYLNNLAMLYKGQGLYAKAEPLYKESLKIIEKVFGKEHPDYGLSLNNLADLYKDQGLYAKSELLYEESLRIKEKVFGKEHPYYVLSLHSLAHLYYLQGLYSKAEFLYKESTRIKLKEYQKNFFGLSEREQYLYLQKDKYLFNSFASFVIDRTGNGLLPIKNPNELIATDFYITQLQIKGLLLNTSQKIKKHILQSNDSILIESFQKWQFLKNEISKKTSSYSESDHENSLDSLKNKANELEKSLSLSSSKYQKITNSKLINLEDIQQILEEDEVVIEMVKCDYRDSITSYIAIFITKEMEYPELVVLHNGVDLETQYYAYHTNHIHFKLDGDTLSYEKYWKTIESKINKVNPKAKTIYFSGDGVYNQINLNNIYHPKEKKYLLDLYDFHYVTNTKDILNSNTTSNDNKAILFGRPNYNMGKEAFEEKTRAYSRSASFQHYYNNYRGLSFSDLPGTEKEVKNIEKVLMKDNQWKVDVFLKEKALEEEVKKMKNPKVLHISTHGFFMKDSVSMTDPFRAMLSSGVVFTGVENYFNSDTYHDTEDGILTAYEASSLDLDSTELVVLSACETGLGNVQSGEGVYGLQRGFLTAGAKAIIMSLWTVDDTATQEFMSTFYQYWNELGDKRKAFLKTQQKMKEKYKFPYYWGAFILVER